MSNKLFVGNLSFNASEGDLEKAFAEHGSVQSVKIITDFQSGRSRGFGFVEMETGEQAQECISNLDGKDVAGREIKVSVAKERTNSNAGGRGSYRGNAGARDRGNRW